MRIANVRAKRNTGYIYYREWGDQRVRPRDVARDELGILTMFAVGQQVRCDPYLVVDVLPDDSTFGVEFFGLRRMRRSRLARYSAGKRA